MAIQHPVIGQWFRRPNGTLFEVVAIDEMANTVEVQQFDGTVDEFDVERWADLLLTEASAPEDWSGSVDMMREDFMTDIGMSTQEDWSDPLDMIDSIAADEY